VRREFIVEVKERLQGYSGNYWFKGYSPLHLAAMNGHELVIKYLIANGGGFKCYQFWWNTIALGD
jgi:hypothetical protein